MTLLQLTVFVNAILLSSHERASIYWTGDNACDTYQVDVNYTMSDNGSHRKNAEVTMRLRVDFTSVKILKATARYESFPANLIYEVDACGSSTISCATAQTHCSLTVAEGICQLDFLYHFYGGGRQMAFSVYKLNDILLSESGLPITLSECLSFSKEYSSEASFETITSFVYCNQTTTAMCKPSEAVSHSTPSTSVFTSAVDASSSSDSTTSALNFSSYDTLQHLANISLNAANVGEVLRLVLKLMQTSSLTPEDIYYISVIVRNASRVPNLLLTDFIAVSEVMDTVLAQPIRLFHLSNNGDLDSTNRFLRSIPDLFRNSPAPAEYMNGNFIALLGRNVDCSPNINKDELLEGIADSGRGFELVTADDHPDIDDGASISVPRDVICRSQAFKYYFVIFRNPNFFVGNESNYRSRDDEMDELTDGCTVGRFLADRRILSATLLKPNSTVSRFSVGSIEETMAILQYGKRKLLSPLHGTFQVSHYLETSGWSDQSCSVFNSKNGRYFESRCEHLTDFTLLVNGMTTDPALCNDVLVSLGLIIGTASVSSLAVLTLVYISKLCHRGRLFKALAFILQYQPRGTDDTLGILYISGLLLFFVTFTYFTDQNVVGGNCTAVAAITYALFLTSIIMTTFQSLKVLSSFIPSVHLECFLRKASNIFIALGVGIGIPLTVCIVTVTTIPEFFRREDRFCWIRPDYTFLAVVFPLGLVSINGLICFLMILDRLFPQLCFQKTTVKQLTRTKSVQRLKIFTLLLVQFTLGVPWIFQYFTLFAPHETVFHYLFNIVNGSQGVILMLIFVFRTIHAHRLRRSLKESKRLYEKMGDEQRRGSTLIDADEARNKETQNENGELKIGPLADLPKEQDTPTFVDCTSVPQLICEQESVCEIAGPSDTSKFFK